MFICEIWLFDWFFPQFCTSDEVWISRSVSEGPLDFEITRVDCKIFSGCLLFQRIDFVLSFVIFLFIYLFTYFSQMHVYRYHNLCDLFYSFIYLYQSTHIA